MTTMKKLLFLTTSLLLFTCLTYSNTWKITITVSEPDAEIFVNGLKIGNSPSIAKIENKSCAQIEIKKIGFLTEKRTWCIGKKGVPEPNKKEFITLKKDESYDASSMTDKANIDFPIEVSKKLSEDAAWKQISMIVTNYIDDIAHSNKETGYLMTAWKVQTFSGKTVRTRIIVKLSNSNPLGYKIKIESQYADEENVSAKADEKFKDWDRVLKKYDNLISEFQTRLGNK